MTNPLSDRPAAVAAVTFRPFRQDADYARMLSIQLESAKADRDPWTPSLDEIKAWCAPTERFDPTKQLVFALAPTKDASAGEVGVSRLGWYTGRNGSRIYVQTSFLLPEFRRGGIWQAMVRESDRRILAIAASHRALSERFLQGWAMESQADWIGALEGEGYRAVRHFQNMVCRLDVLPEAEWPAGLEVRPAKTGHMRAIWEAQREVNQELFEYVAEQWLEERYPEWLVDSSHTPRLWQVAWDGDQVAGMVLPRIDDDSNPGQAKKRGYTEHVFVRRPWRGRGLAKALLARSLRILKEHGMEEAELGVDSENDSGAFGLYSRLGYVTERTDIWFRKPLDADAASG